jgi:triphosphoribosyl-dephospho-CoA synthetase
LKTKEGLKKGREEGKIEVAKKLLLHGLDTKSISKNLSKKSANDLIKLLYSMQKDR